MPYLSQILAGQIANGFRSALDYLVGRVAELDSGPSKRRTQFPIESCAEGFLRRKSTFLKGLNTAHIAVIERLQPYNGCAWTGRLAELSNLDKHNALIPAKMDFLYSGILDPIKGTKARPRHYKVRMHITPTVYVGIGNGYPLVETLRKIGTGVAQTLTYFDAEFK
ncbi:MAG TPA: hypothetical protein VK335_08245 [Bryobacteraceae bacterium]|nr:hypothetical protein [Bryobacteraceae bacterium]